MDGYSYETCEKLTLVELQQLLSNARSDLDSWPLSKFNFPAGSWDVEYSRIVERLVFWERALYHRLQDFHRARAEAVAQAARSSQHLED